MDNVTNIEPADNEERLLKGILEGDESTNIEPAGNKERLLKAILEKLGGSSWSQTNNLPLQLQNDQQFAEDPSYIKCSNSVLTAEQLVGAVMTIQGTGSVTITSEMLVDLQQEMGVNATAIVVPDYGPVFIVAYSADTPIPSTGLYINSDYRMAVILNRLTFSYTDTFTAEMRPIAVGTAEYESGVTDMPSGVVYFQLEA